MNEQPVRASLDEAVRDLIKALQAASRLDSDGREVAEQDVLDAVESAQGWIDTARDDIVSEIRFRRALAKLTS